MFNTVAENDVSSSVIINQIAYVFHKNTMSTSQQTSSIKIRPMRLNDLEQVHLIDSASFSTPWPERAFRFELQQNPTSFLFVAEIFQPDGHSTLAGAIVVWMIVDEAHIATIAVHPNLRERGVGKKLLISALKKAVHKGATTATLEVRAHNLIAQSFYKRFKFIVVGRRPRYYRDNDEDALIMTADNLGEEYLNWLENSQGDN